MGLAEVPVTTRDLFSLIVTGLVVLIEVIAIAVELRF